jgi:hypothetical protein
MLDVFMSGAGLPSDREPDVHLKNFAMLHTPDGMRLSPAYDLVAYPEYRTFALSIDGVG